MSRKKPSESPEGATLLVHLRSHSSVSGISSSMGVKTERTIASVMIDAFTLGVGTHTPTRPSRTAAGSNNHPRLGGGAAVPRVAPCQPARCQKATWPPPMRIQCRRLSLDQSRHIRQDHNAPSDLQASSAHRPRRDRSTGAARFAGVVVAPWRRTRRAPSVVEVRACWRSGPLRGLPSPVAHLANAPALPATLT